MPTIPAQHFRCEILSWEKVAEDALALSQLIKDSGFDPTIVVAIGRGGYVPARMLCDYLFIKDLTSIKIEHWGVAATPDKKAVLKFPLCADIHGKRVLLVDDITDTGDTLRTSLAYMERFHPQNVKTAVLIHKTTSNLQPDYYVREINKWRWVIFPWHLWEDLASFLREIKTTGILSIEDMVCELDRRYGIKVDIETVKRIMLDIMEKNA